MGYDVAVAKAWLELEEISEKKKYTIRLLSDEYTVDVEDKRILSLSCNVSAKDSVSILVLHYLARSLKGLPVVTNEWVSFQQFEGGQGYYPAFQARTLKPILRKYESKPEALLELTSRFKAKRVQLADIALVFDVFDGVPFVIEMWRGDDEFGPEANMLFDKSITDIFCTEDIVVLSEFVVHQI